MNTRKFFRMCAALLGTGLAVGAFSQEPPVPDVMEALPEHLIYLYSGTAEASPAGALSQLYAGSRRWEPGRVLRVCMFSGNEVVATLVRQAANEWNDYSSVKLDFGPAPRGYNCLSPGAGHFQVRIGFSGQGYWSALGNDSEIRLDAYAPSMNLQGFNRLYSPDRMPASAVLAQAEPYHVATIKHEFGHALGLLHEHQNPALSCTDEIKWTGSGNVYEYYARPPNGWSTDQVQRNLGFIGQTDPDFVAGASDSKSIMMYALPAAVLKQGTASPCFVPVRYAISDKDKLIVAQIYPPFGSPTRMPSDIDLKAATVKPLAALATPQEVTDTKVRILVDLESSDAYTRRNARARMADLISKIPQAEATTLIRSANAGSYRLQLGTAVAVVNAPAELRLSADAKRTLSMQARGTTDATLRRQLTLATER
jgi:hypothetical protein